MIWGPGYTKEHPRQTNIEASGNFSLTIDFSDSFIKKDASPPTEKITPLLRLQNNGK